MNIILNPKEGSLNVLFMEKISILVLKYTEKLLNVLLVIELGDLIQFVQYLFSLSFKEAMEKINQDFNLNIDSKYKIDIKKIKQIEKEREQKRIQQKRKNEYYMKLCRQRLYLNKKIKELKKEINILNWEQQEYLISKMQMKLDILDIEIDNRFQEF